MWIEGFILFSSILHVKAESVLGTVLVTSLAVPSGARAWTIVIPGGVFQSLNSSAIDVPWMNPWSGGTFDREFSNFLL